MLKKATQVAVTETTVLLTGESGTGKEVGARFIHRASARRSGPFVALNCAALPEQLLESELFGYERGAFTGAQQAKPGQIELASGGVLFLDEVSEMSLSAQAKFLRVLQEREFQRLGGTHRIRANVRVIAATNRDLRQGGRARRRSARTSSTACRCSTSIPPLRERRGDILLLSDAFLEEIGPSLGRPPAGLTRDAREALVQYRLAGERPRASKRARARRHPVRRRPDLATASRAARRRSDLCNHHRPERRRAGDDRTRDARYGRGTSRRRLDAWGCRERSCMCACGSMTWRILRG